MRANAQKMMPDTCTILRLARTSNGAGGIQEEWVPVATVACRLDDMSAGAKGERDLNVEAGAPTLFVPWDAPLETSGRIRHGEVNYALREVLDDPAPLIVKRALVMRVDAHRDRR